MKGERERYRKKTQREKEAHIGKGRQRKGAKHTYRMKRIYRERESEIA